MRRKIIVTIIALAAFCAMSHAQKYNVVDKTAAVVGNEAILVSTVENEVKTQQSQGMSSDRNMRCELLESIMESKLFLMQARLDSLTVNQDMVEGNLSQQLDRALTYLGGEDKVEAYFGKPVYRLRQEWRLQFEEMSLTQQEQQKIVGSAPEMTPFDVKEYMDTVDKQSLPVVPIKYQLSQICIYPDREAANLAVREKLLGLRERIINGEKFGTLARIYSEDPGSSRRGGELGMASKSIFWPAFSDAAMSLKPNVISQIVETPDGFHIIEVIEKSGDMFNARHILMKPQYTDSDREKAFRVLDSLRTEILAKAVTFQMAANFYSQDPATKTNGGQMVDPNTGSAYFEIDQIKAEDYNAVKNLKEGDISLPVQSLDNEGHGGNTVYKIIRVDRIVPAHTANFQEDFTLLQEQVNRSRQMKVIDEFLNEKIGKTHIVIDPMFRDCEFRRPGWSAKFKSAD